MHRRSMSIMEQFSDDVLVKVLQYVAIEDLFACRLVCSRLARVALDRDVWRHRKVIERYNRREEPCVCPVLRLAPCLDALGLMIPLRRCRLAYTSTRCAVAELRVSICSLPTSDISGVVSSYIAAAVLSRQEALGRLRRLRFDTNPGADGPTFIATLASTLGLEELKVLEICAPTGSNPAEGCTVLKSSLRHFKYTLEDKVSEYFTNFILNGHAATLEVVNLGSRPSPGLTASVASSLAGVPNLTELTCCTLPGMEAMAACEKLRVLDLIVGTENQHRAAAVSAAKFLQRTKNLRRLRLQYKPWIISNEDNVGAERVMRALASPGMSRLERLTIVNWVDEENEWNEGAEKPFPPLQALIIALPSLTSLQYLELITDVHPGKFLPAISPTTLPALQKLDLVLPQPNCVHALVHGVAYKTVMSAYPRLHIELRHGPITHCVTFEDDDDDDDDGNCETCQSDCQLVGHEELLRIAKLDCDSIVLFSHDPADKCSEKGHFSGDDFWIHISQ